MIKLPSELAPGLPCWNVNTEPNFNVTAIFGNSMRFVKNLRKFRKRDASYYGTVNPQLNEKWRKDNTECSIARDRSRRLCCPEIILRGRTCVKFGESFVEDILVFAHKLVALRHPILLLM